ncbi:phosphatidylinositol 4-kinase A, partial [Tremellales sp. Uapishka_1]
MLTNPPPCSLDNPLHLQILSSLASNLAVGATDSTDHAGSQTEDINVLLKGLPEVDASAELSPGDDDEGWTEFETNHAISYAHYVSSLPLESTYLPKALPKLRSLLNGLLGQGQMVSASSHASSPSGASSSALSSEMGGTGTATQGQLCEGLLRAMVWVGWSSESLRGELASELIALLEKVERMIQDGRFMTFPLVLLAATHHALMHIPLPIFPTTFLPKIITTLISLAAPSNLVKMVRQNSSSSISGLATKSPTYNRTAPHPTTPGGVVIIVADLSNIFLAGNLLPETVLHQRTYAHLPALDHSFGLPHIPADQTKSLLYTSLSPDVASSKLSATAEGRKVLEEAGSMVTKWWTEVIGMADTEGGESGLPRKGSLFTLGGSAADEEIELSGATLVMMTMLALHQEGIDETQLTRLKLLLSENSTVSDPRILEVAFISVAILVRNHPSLGTTMTHHIRRLLMSPLPAFEGEMAATGMEMPPCVVAASKCLAICIEMSSNHDLVSSTLYSLLNTLTHASGSTIVPGAAMSVKSGSHHHGSALGKRDIENMTFRTAGSGGKKTEEQKALVGVTAVEVVSRLALEIGKDDVIHLGISMLLQRLRGVDLVTEATIVTNLVPLALAGSNADLVEVYRAFSQISRSSHPEDPRISSNAVLAAQTTLAKGLASRLDCADGYLVELLTLFADKGTQTQMVAMAPAGFNSRDKEKLAHLAQDSESRVSDMKSWLAALLIPISELLLHSNYHPHHAASSELVAHFRNLWFLCVVFGLSGSAGRKRLSDHELNALSNIAVKTPALVLESANDYVASDLEYNSILRKDFAASILTKQRNLLSECLTTQRLSYEIRNMTTPQTTLLLAIFDLEEARTIRNHPSVILQYFSNESVNTSTLIGCLDGIAAKLSSSFLKQLSRQAVTHSLPQIVSEEVRKILVACTHRFRKVRETALTYARQIIETFSALMCVKEVVFTLLEILTLMRRSCELQYTDEYSPVYEFRSDKMDLTLQLTDDYAVRNEIVTQLHAVARSWLTLAISRAPIEVQSTLQQYLNESKDVLLIDSVEMGAGLALHYAKVISRLDRQETIMPNIGGWPSDSSNLVASQFASKNYFNGELSGARMVLGKGLDDLQKDSPSESSVAELDAFKSQMAEAVMNIKKKTRPFTVPEIRRILLRAVSALVASPKMDNDILHYLVELPMTAFTPLAIAAGVDAWTWLLRKKPEAEIAVIAEISAGWLATIRARRGLFSDSMNYCDPFEKPVEYSPSDKKIMDLELAKARRLLRPHLLLIQVLSSQFQAIKYREPGIMVSLIRLMMRSLKACGTMSTHPLAREVRFSLLLFGFQILASSRMEALLELRFRDRLYQAAFSWFSVRPQWSFGSDRIQVGAEMKLLADFMTAIQEDHIRGDHSTTSMPDRSAAILVNGATNLHDYTLQHRDRVKILQLLVENEISRLSVWCNPANEGGRLAVNVGAMERSIANEEWTSLTRKAWKQSPAMTVHMGERFQHLSVQLEITRLVQIEPKAVVDVPEALHFLLGDKLEAASRKGLQWLPVWAAVPPVPALVYFNPRYGNHPLILQYAMRVLEQHPVELTFFFVPQVVQALRSDGLGYVERFIFETSKISQLFCHQIIWNMKANTYRDDDIADPMKPMLDRMVDMIVAELSGKARAFYDQEFTFFDAVTSISGKLKPFIKKTKPEKKAKIDEEMAKIDLSVGVYLPSNPDGVVVDLDRKSGRPLQSHAKAPFMATFLVQKEKMDLPTNASVEIADEAQLVKTKYDVWQSAIFKVGDDCRQDVLALQIIAMFKNVFTSIGLVLYLFPYRVTATAPGCGVIDVVPNATSRDEMGRAKINDLFSYFVDKYGTVDSIPFQKARLNFIQSMAAYSVACYILQIKDRHNGNIMIDGEGHIGVKFEPNSFKLNHEMVVLMGGRESQGYKMFTELTVKAFLAIRPHAIQLVDACHLMLGTGLPSFKGEPTIKRLKDRFQLQLGERAAAEYMMGVIRNAHENMRSNVYDGFQKMQK